MNAPFSFASFIAASVSAVSPLWLTATTMSSLKITGFLYLNSLAYSTSTGIWQASSMKYLPMRAECQLVPQAQMMILRAFRNRFLLSNIPDSITSLFFASILPPRQVLIASGCSYISFSMKWA